MPGRGYHSIVVTAHEGIRVEGGAHVELFLEDIPADIATEELQQLMDEASELFELDGTEREIRIGPGTVLLTEKLFRPSGVWLRGAGPGITTIRNDPSWTPVAADADSTNNFLIGIEGRVDDTFNTTLSNAITPGGVLYFGPNAREVSVTSAVGLVADEYVIIGGHEDLTGYTPGGSNGSAVDYWEIQHPNAVVGNNLALRWGTLQYHDVGAGAVGTPRSIKRLEPNRRGGIADMTISATGSTHAVGVRIAWAMECTIDNVLFEGFSRAGIECCFGSMDLVLRRVVKGTDCACGIYGRSAHQVLVSEFRTLSDIDSRFHSLGLRRAAIVTEDGCCNWNIDQPEIHNVVQGISVRGGYHIEITGGTIDGCYIFEQVIDIYHRSIRGSCICTGNSEVTMDEFVGPVIVTGVATSDGRDLPTNFDAGEPVWAMCVIHDVHGSNVTGCIFDNRGLSWNTVIDGDANYALNGVLFQDADGTFADNEIRGCQYPILFRSGSGMFIDGVREIPPPGTGTATSILLWLGVNSDTIGLNHIRNVYGAGYFLVEAGFVHGGTLQFGGDWFLDPLTIAGPLYLAQNTTGVLLDPGAIVGVDPAQAQLKLIPVGAADSVGSIAHSSLQVPNNFYCLFKPGRSDGAMIQCSGTVAIGDVVGVAPGVYTATVAAGAARPIQRALSARSGAGSSLVKAGPP